MSTEEVQALVEALRVCASAGACKTCERDLYCEPTKMLSDAAAAIEEQLPKRGEWVGVSPTVDTVQCSVCGGQLFSAELETPYCPYCGAKMEVQE